MLLLKRTKPIPKGHTTAILQHAIAGAFLGMEIPTPEAPFWLTIEQKTKCAILMWALDRFQDTTVAELLYFESSYGKDKTSNVEKVLKNDKGLVYDPEEGVNAGDCGRIYNEIMPHLEAIENSMRSMYRFYPWQAIMNIVGITNPL